MADGSPSPASRSRGGWRLPLIAAAVVAVTAGAAFAGVHGWRADSRDGDAAVPGWFRDRLPQPSGTGSATRSTGDSTEPVAGFSPPQRAGASPEPGQPGQPGEPADFSELAEQVSAIRGLSLERRLRARVTDGPALADKISDLAFAEFDPEQLEADRRLLVALRLAPADLDLAALLEQLYREQILGVYVPKEKTLYVREAAAQLSPAGELTAAHEIAHALQDQAFDLEEIRSAVSDDVEASLARLSLIEGDAVLTSQLWSQRHQSDDDRRQAALPDGDGGNDVLSRTPRYLRNSLFFPYVRGAAFVGALYSHGGYAAIDAAYRSPPATSEHILHPEKYLAGEEPSDVSFQGGFGRDWRRLDTYTFGEFDLLELFAPLGADVAAAAAQGWGGGQAAVLASGDDTAVALRLAFDSPADGAQACDALPRWYVSVAEGRTAGDGLLQGDGDVLAYECGETTVTAGLAPTGQAAQRLLETIGD